MVERLTTPVPGGFTADRGEVPVARFEPLTDEQVSERLAELPGWQRDGDAITRMFAHTWHECVHLTMYVAAKAREVQHHPDIAITWQRVRFQITTQDAGSRLTEKDFELARHIDEIAAGHGAEPV